MAFSLLSGKQLFLILATSAALLLVAYLLFFRSRGKLLQQIAFILVLAGGIGNLIDRVLNGEVVDYINPLFIDFAVFQLRRHPRLRRCGALGAGNPAGRSGR